MQNNKVGHRVLEISLLTNRLEGVVAARKNKVGKSG